VCEAALSYLGLGVTSPNPAGECLRTRSTRPLYLINPAFMIIPSMAIFGVAMPLDLFGEELRDAPDPTSSQ